MSAPSPLSQSFLGSVFLARLALIAGACGLIGVLPYLFTAEDTKVVSYTAPKEAVRKPPVEPVEKGKPGKLWGAIVPQASELWFFKATGPVAEMSQRESELKSFLQSIRFTAGEPKWTLPDGWQQRPGFDFIFATISIPTDQSPLELSVSRLPRGDGPLEDQLLANINRWRDQISLSTVKSDELAATTERLDVNGVEATLLSVEGTIKPRPMRGPFVK